MVYRIQAHLKFASAGARTTGRSTISSAISGRNTTVVRDLDVLSTQGDPSIYWEGEESSTGDAGIIYAQIQAMASPLAGSVARHHTCFHGDNRNACINTAQKVWP